MNHLEELQATLDILWAEHAQIAQSWYLQNCWMTQTKAGGTARTNRKYWQVRSRQPVFNGKTSKYLKADEVEAYKAAIEQGRKLQQIDRQIEKLQQQLAELSTTNSSYNQLLKRHIRINSTYNSAASNATSR